VIVYHLYFPPVHPRTQTGTGGFENRFLGGKAGGKILGVADFGTAVFNFAGGINPFQETIPMAINHFSQALHFRYIDPD
jgi:hypothetical protein